MTSLWEGLTMRMGGNTNADSLPKEPADSAPAALPRARRRRRPSSAGDNRLGQNSRSRSGLDKDAVMSTYQVTARNHAEASENRIHNDDIARRYGFEGALVPGMTVYGYLTHPLVARFGERWLSHSVG